MSLAETSVAVPERSEEAPFEMANLRPKTTGLPMTVWISSRGNARHDARVKVSRVHGNTLDPDDLAVMTVRPVPILLHGRLDRADIEAVAEWIRLNEIVLIDIWNGDGDPVSEAQRFQRV